MDGGVVVITVASEFNIAQMAPAIRNRIVRIAESVIVGVSKCLHFLIPDLVMPIDSTCTMTAFYGHNRFSNTLEKDQGLHSLFQDYSQSLPKTQAQPGRCDRRSLEHLDPKTHRQRHHRPMQIRPWRIYGKDQNPLA